MTPKSTSEPVARSRPMSPANKRAAAIVAQRRANWADTPKGAWATPRAEARRALRAERKRLPREATRQAQARLARKRQRAMERQAVGPAAPTINTEKAAA